MENFIAYCSVTSMILSLVCYILLLVIDKKTDRIEKSVNEIKAKIDGVDGGEE